MSRIKDVAKAILSGLEPKPNQHLEQAMELIDGLEPAARAQTAP